MSFFDLANYGMKIAKEKILRGECPTLSQVIEDLVKLPDELKAH